MSKLEIIQALLLAKEAYTEAIEAEKDHIDDFHSSYTFYLCGKQLASGFCYYFNTWKEHDESVVDAAVSELNADAKRVDGLLTWYHVALDCRSNKDKVKLALQPRLDNINRTIARLQEELKTESHD